VEISSDGEFKDASNIKVFDEDDSYINVIEQNPNSIQALTQKHYLKYKQ
jgi:hypothetical protein